MATIYAWFGLRLVRPLVDWLAKDPLDSFCVPSMFPHLFSSYFPNMYFNLIYHLERKNRSVPIKGKERKQR